METGKFSDTAKQRLSQFLMIAVIFLTSVQGAIVAFPTCSELLTTGCFEAVKIAFWGGVIAVAISIFTSVQMVVDQWIATSSGLTTSLVILGATLITGVLDLMDVFNWNNSESAIVRLILGAIAATLSVFSRKAFPSAELKAKQEQHRLEKTFGR